MSTTIPAGFTFEGKQIFFVEPRDKDIGFPRWRANLYYGPHLALTAFFASEAAYIAFLFEAAKHTFPTYADYRAMFDKITDGPYVTNWGPARSPGDPGPCPADMDDSEWLARNNID